MAQALARSSRWYAGIQFEFNYWKYYDYDYDYEYEYEYKKTNHGPRPGDEHNASEYSAG
jgi:hypothetical protein